MGLPHGVTVRMARWPLLRYANNDEANLMSSGSSLNFLPFWCSYEFLSSSHFLGLQNKSNVFTLGLWDHFFFFFAWEVHSRLLTLQVFNLLFHGLLPFVLYFHCFYCLKSFWATLFLFIYDIFWKSLLLVADFGMFPWLSIMVK